jgi:hypothetical protein
MGSASTLEEWVRTYPNYRSINALAASPERTLAFGDSGTVVVSEEFQAWMNLNQDARLEFLDAAYGNGVYVCLARGIQGLGVLHSSDGIGWTRMQPPVSFDRVRFAKDRFFGLGPDGSIHSSTDGVEWELKRSGEDGSVLSDVVSGGKVFTAIGRKYWRALVLTSENGEDWELAPQLPTEDDNPGYGAAFGNGVFVVAAGYDNFALRGGRIWRSVDGYHWENRYLSGEVLNSVAFGNGTFVAVGSNGAAFVSTDGEQWTEVSTGTLDHLEAIIHTASGFLAVSRRALDDLIQSTDGLTWRPWNLVRGPWLDPARVIFALDRFIAVGGDGGGAGGGQILHSDDGVSWVAASFPTEPASLFGLTYGQDRFVAVGVQQIWTSVDGHAWRPAARGTSEVLRAVAGDETVFVAVGETSSGPSRAVLLWSADGELWESVVGFEDLPAIYAVAHGPGQFVALAPGVALQSTDGKNWVRYPLTEKRALMDVAYANGQYVAVGTRAIATSTDGTQWSILPDDSFPDFRGVFWDGGRWIACGRDETWQRARTIWISIDGQAWVPQSWTNPLNSIAFGKGAYVAGGRYLFQSIQAPPRLEIGRLLEGYISITAEATPETQLNLERSTNLRDWTPWNVIVPAGNSVSLIDQASQEQQFYRARQDEP